MIFASKRLNNLETRLESAISALENLQLQWEQERLAMSELQETASHMLSRITMRNKRAMKAEAEGTATTPSPESSIDPITLAVLERRGGVNAIPSNGR